MYSLSDTIAKPFIIRSIGNIALFRHHRPATILPHPRPGKVSLPAASKPTQR
ncbi:hypothetical protein [Prevotella corporis]|uniref:hypothetical protein n=1 Tax=Prevotella corporis TaxID=28128 RepID=UPI0023669546|nr:hypothetical protein [Prevotella corporis]